MPAHDDPAQVFETPILDSGVLPSGARRWKLSGIIIGLAFGFVSGFFLLHLGGEADHNAGLALRVLSLFLALALAITVHEVGHVIAGWAVGFRFNSIVVGPFLLQLEHGTLRIRVRRELSVLGYAGMHATSVKKLRRRLLIVLAAGPLVNLLSIPVTIILVNHAPWLEHTWVIAAAAQFVFLSLLFAIGSVSAKSVRYSDGARITMLKKSPAEARRWLSLAALDGQHYKGVRPRDWKITWLRAATSLHDGKADEFLGNWSAYIWAIDRKDMANGACYLERCLELVPLVWPSTVDLAAQEAAFFSAWFRKDPHLADSWVSQVKRQKLLPRLVQIRLSASLRAARNDFRGSLADVQAGLAFIERLPSSLAHERLREGWLEWREEVEERQELVPD